MSDFRVTMTFELPDGFTEEQFWHYFYGSTKHSGLSWCIDSYEELEAEENDCE